MTWLDIILYGPGWLACIMIPLGPWIDRKLERRFRRQYRERWGVEYRNPA